MIQVCFLQQPNGELLGFEIQGHSGQEASGSDVLCAAVSSAAYLITNAITDVVRVPAQISVAEGLMAVTIDEKSVFLCRNLLEGLKIHLLGLEEQYPENIRVSYTEV